MSPRSAVRLLVSVRDLAEARSASHGGADIVDIKEPAHGSLGRAETDVMRRIVDHICAESPETPLSAALGEVTEINDVSGVCLPAGLTYAKLGLSGLRRQSDWVAEWVDVRRTFENGYGGTGPQWVAVAYADAESAAAPPVTEVLEAAIQTGCAGFLIDTFHKQSGRLLDLISGPSLTELAARTREQGLFFAVAGRLRTGDVPMLRPVQPDVIAVRSAACVGDDRRAHVCPQQVRALREAITEGIPAVANAPLSVGLTANR